MNLLTQIQVRMAHFIADRREQMKDEGAGLIEYAALVILAAIVFGFLYAAFTEYDIAGKITEGLTDIFEGEGRQV